MSTEQSTNIPKSSDFTKFFPIVCYVIARAQYDIDVVSKTTRKVEIFDTLLRDGDQTPGGAQTFEEKRLITDLLCQLGIDVLEVGFPASASDFSSEITKSGLREKYPNTKVCVLARTVKADIGAAKKALSEVNKGCKIIHTFIATSPVHRKLKLGGKSIPEICEMVGESVSSISRDKDVNGESQYQVIFSPEDATNTPWEDLKKVIKVAVESGARTINIPDTIGTAQPSEIFSLIKKTVIYTKQLKLLLGLKEDITIAFHGHNDSGMAVVNTLAAIRAGAKQIQTTPAGQGERQGNSSLINVIMAMIARPDTYSKYTNNLNYERFYTTLKEIDGIMGTSYLSQVERQFYHASGIHQANVAQGIIDNITSGAVIKEGLLYDPTNGDYVEIKDVYQPINGNSFGFRPPFYGLVLTKHSGVKALKAVLMMNGFEVPGDKIEQVRIEFSKRINENLNQNKERVFSREDILCLATDFGLKREYN